VRRCDQRG
ncbi:aminotransferase class-III family protein, partial [Vibrio parahaemolyticus VPTS-2010_2]